MKLAIALSVLALSPAFAFAHGSIPHQAADAVEAATQLFEASQTTEVRRQFVGIAAVLAGHETFNVTVTLKNNTQVQYVCVENEDVEPVVWECAAR